MYKSTYQGHFRDPKESKKRKKSLMGSKLPPYPPPKPLGAKPPVAAPRPPVAAPKLPTVRAKRPTRPKRLSHSSSSLELRPMNPLNTYKPSMPIKRPTDRYKNYKYEPRPKPTSYKSKFYKDYSKIYTPGLPTIKEEEFKAGNPRLKRYNKLFDLKSNQDSKDSNVTVTKETLVEETVIEIPTSSSFSSTLSSTMSSSSLPPLPTLNSIKKRKKDDYIEQTLIGEDLFGESAEESTEEPRIKIKTSNNHVMFLHLANTYEKDWSNSLARSIKPIIKKCKDIFEDSDVIFEEIINTRKMEFMQEIQEIAEDYKDGHFGKNVKDDNNLHHIENLVILYSGHGYYSRDDKIAGIITQDMHKISIPEILKHFDYVSNVFLVFDACRNNKYVSPTKEQLSNDRIIMLFPSAKGYVTPGGDITYALLESFESRLHLNIILQEINLLNIMIDTIDKFNKKIPSYQRHLPKYHPKIYANDNMRNLDKEAFNKLMKVTSQDIQSVAVTEINQNILSSKRRLGNRLGYGRYW